MSRPLRVAVIHYWLVAMRGGERVLERVLRLFPEAEIYTHVYDPSAVSDEIRRRVVHTTFIDALPFSRKLYQRYLPLMPSALEAIDLRGYDLVLSFEAGPAKGVIAPPDALHVCYCHSPMRYLWDAYAEYRATAGLMAKLAMPLTFPGLRVWDQASSARVDGIIANSSFIRRRIRRAWNRDSVVVHPPAPVEALTVAEVVGDHFLWVGQMTPYKRADLAVDAFSRWNAPLQMIGRGEMSKNLRARAGDNVTFTEGLSFAELAEAYATCRGLIYTAEEDFGIIPVEAMAAGRPVLALGRGGVLDSVIPGETGLFFDEQTVDSLLGGLAAFEAWLPTFDADKARSRAAHFSGSRFDRAYLQALAGFAMNHPRVAGDVGARLALLSEDAGA